MDTPKLLLAEVERGLHMNAAGEVFSERKKDEALRPSFRRKAERGVMKAKVERSFSFRRRYANMKRTYRENK